MRRMRVVKPKPGKKVPYEAIYRTTDEGRAMYARVDAIREQDQHQWTSEANVALAWCVSWKPDADGIIPLAKCRKASELDREFVKHDFVILINRAWWFDLEVTEEAKAAILDHELMHMAPACDADTGEPKRDERGRQLWRLRKHDLEEFIGIFERHGAYTRTHERAYAAMRRAAHGGFKSCGTCDERGFIQVDAITMRRCACWVTWQARINADAVAEPAPAEAAAS